MNVLVSAASTHGSTAAIAHAIADELRSHGHHVDCDLPDFINSVEPYDAFVIGSAVYFGRWMASARELVEHHAAELRTKPVWLFSSGPLGDLRDDPSRAEGERLRKLIEGRIHRVFDGALDKDDLGVRERVAIGITRAPYGDFRDWSLIRSWARSIAVDLDAEVAPV